MPPPTFRGILVLAYSTLVATASSPALDSFVDHLTGSGPERSPGVSKCLSSSVHPRSAVLRDARHQPVTGSPDAAVLTSSLKAYPDLASLLFCVLSAGEIPPPTLDTIGGALMFSAASFVGATHSIPGGPAALFKAILKASPNATSASLPSDSQFTLAHHVIATKSIIIGQLASYLMSLQDDRYGDRARDFARDLAESVAAVLSTADSNASLPYTAIVADAVRGAGRDMSSGLGRGGALSQAPLLTLRAGMSAALLHTVLLEYSPPAARAATAGVEEVLAADGKVEGLDSALATASTGVSVLAAMASTPDAFGRTPLHVAGALGDALSTAVLLHALRASGSSEAAVEGVVRMRDAAGWTAAELARAIGAAELAAMLEGDGGAGAHPPALPVLTQPPTAERDVPSAEEDDGGWTNSFVSSAAAAAVGAVTSPPSPTSSALSSCDIAVVDASALSPEAFAAAAYAPRVPVLVRGALSTAARDAWRADRVIEEWGHLAVLPSAVPSGVPGGGGGQQQGFGRPAPPITLTAFIDAMRLCDGGDPRDNPPWLDAGTCSALASAAGPASVWKALESGDVTDSALIARIESELPAFLTHAALMRNATTAAPVYLPASAGGHVTAQVYVGGAGSGAALHHHGDAVNGLSWGLKRWVLVPPLRAAFDTRTTAAQHFRRSSGGDVDEKSALECTQEAGDVVYVPRGWGHAVLNLRPSVGWAVEFRGPFERYH
jgi:hypothetical protein